MGCATSKPADLPPKVNVGVCNSPGKRKYNEDRFAMYYPLPSVPQTACFAVFDGHSGVACAKYCEDQFAKYLAQYAAPKFDPEGVTEAFMRCDNDFLSMAVPREMRDGSTATVLTVSHDRLMCANVGDSRCIVSRGGTALELSIDHKASEPGESARLKKIGAKIRGKYIRSRASTSMIAVARAMGDKDYKTDANPLDRLLLSVPHISYVPLADDVQFALIASDGLWDVIDNQVAVNFVLSELANGLSAPQIARKLVIKALNRRSSDNITALVVVFPDARFDFARARADSREPDSDSGDSIASYSSGSSSVDGSSDTSTDDSSANQSSASRSRS